MKTTIILAHPWEGSFNRSILTEVMQILGSKGIAYQLIDLNADAFNPVMTKEQLHLSVQGKSDDPLVLKYQDMIKNSSDLIFIFPIWWYDVPAILKGFIDKVMLRNFAYTEKKTGIEGILTHLNSATVITTAQSPKWYLKFFAGNVVQAVFINRTLKGLGIKKGKWIHHGLVASGSNENRANFLDTLKKNLTLIK